MGLPGFLTHLHLYACLFLAQAEPTNPCIHIQHMFCRRFQTIPSPWHLHLSHLLSSSFSSFSSLIAEFISIVWIFHKILSLLFHITYAYINYSICAFLPFSTHYKFCDFFFYIYNTKSNEYGSSKILMIKEEIHGVKIWNLSFMSSTHSWRHHLHVHIYSNIQLSPGCKANSKKTRRWTGMSILLIK